MKKLVEQIKLWEFLIGLLITMIMTIWGVFLVVNKFMDELKLIQKTTLRNTIWNENLLMSDRFESCDHYLELGFNSQIKRYCNELLERKKIKNKKMFIILIFDYK